ncbi:hypothetical protein Aconfl_33390 [Algoriphagus confluentis]|uniref:Uncharacterized protein n=1 Tax=Algoriphagus confluentis TaxID=1697556 RepID=A0ABQ6PRR7_9BACT|nr:hypothetical protein Aconfl_33390 [Algoriphagus confluentis]
MNLLGLNSFRYQEFSKGYKKIEIKIISDGGQESWIDNKRFMEFLIYDLKK